MTTEATKTLTDNRQASHNFFLLDRFEAGMVLTGTEVKSAKSGKVQLRDAYAMIDKNEAWLFNAHISEYSHGNRANHPPVRRASSCCIAGRSINYWSKQKKKGCRSSPLAST